MWEVFQPQGALTLENTRVLEGHELHNAGRPENGNLRRKILLSSSSRMKSRAAHGGLDWKKRDRKNEEMEISLHRRLLRGCGEKNLKKSVWSKEDEAKKQCQSGLTLTLFNKE